VQEAVLAGLAAGPAKPDQWGLARRPVDFYDVKADVEALLALTREPRSFAFEPATHPALHPGQAAVVSRAGTAIGLLGALRPEHLRALDLEAPVYLFELRLDAIAAGSLPRFTPLSRFPAIRRDVAVVVPEGLPAHAVQACIGQAAGDMLKNLELFDVYRGEGVDPGRKSLALALTLQAPDRTLQDEEVDRLMGRVVGALERELGANLRG
jgi:phenylalanyl-tRNA synthetase beta chain